VTASRCADRYGRFTGTVADFSGIRTEWTLNVDGEFPLELWCTPFIRRLELRISPKNGTAKRVVAITEGSDLGRGQEVFLFSKKYKIAVGLT
jgi:hypothetical protein